MTSALSPMPLLNDSLRTDVRSDLIERYCTVRQLSLKICEPLESEDYVIQTMPDVSPPKWHLAHTTWFFEAFLLSRFQKNFQPFDPLFHFLFNSYYNSLGTHLERAHRGYLSRPGTSVVFDYRKEVDQKICTFLESCTSEQWLEIEAVLSLGLNHEEQHQELLVTDLKYNLCMNPIHPVYKSTCEITHSADTIPPLNWIEFQGGVASVGAPNEGFSFDHERPRHTVLLEEFRLASRLVTNGEFSEFIENGGYTQPEYWLSLGWEIVIKEDWMAPLYWELRNSEWWVATLSGLEKVALNEPVSHVSYFEADAYARWRGARLPTESEWEVAAQSLPVGAIRDGHFLNLDWLHPRPAKQTSELQQMLGDVWEWTSSAYLPYPGFKPLEGSAGEYNGKFMSNQMVLRGGSCATPFGHIRPSYRNFFPPHSRWQFTGIRLARNGGEREQ